MDLFDGFFMLAIVVLALLLPKVSPCCGCLEADNDECRKDCVAFIAYQKKSSRRD